MSCLSEIYVYGYINTGPVSRQAGREKTLAKASTKHQFQQAKDKWAFHISMRGKLNVGKQQ